jgi:hypothetical protein
VRFTGFKAAQNRRLVGDGADHDAVEAGAAAVEAVEGAQLHLLVRRDAIDLERPRRNQVLADVGAKLVERRRAKDNGVGVRQALEIGHIGHFERDHNRLLVGHLDRHHVAAADLRAGIGIGRARRVVFVEQAVERALDSRSRHGRAVVEGQPLLHREGIHRAVVRKLPALGQRRLRLRALLVVEEHQAARDEVDRLPIAERVERPWLQIALDRLGGEDERSAGSSCAAGGRRAAGGRTFGPGCPRRRRASAFGRTATGGQEAGRDRAAEQPGAQTKKTTTVPLEFCVCVLVHKAVLTLLFLVTANSDLS